MIAETDTQSVTWFNEKLFNAVNNVSNVVNVINTLLAIIDKFGVPISQ